MPTPTTKKTEPKQPTEDPRVAELKLALEPFARLEAEDWRKDDNVLIVRGVSITAGDVRRAIEAMKV
jgi:hypothetical protein